MTIDSLNFTYRRFHKGMTYIIMDACIGTKDASCVDVCPVDCIHPRQDEPEYEKVEMLYIDPDECIDCGACEPACPVEAIYPDFDLPPEMEKWLEVNADYFK